MIASVFNVVKNRHLELMNYEAESTKAIMKQERAKEL